MTTPVPGPSTRRVGLFGGTFDPPHVGHLVVADQVRNELGLDEVWLVVANDPWQKDGTRTLTAAAIRLAMTRAAVSGADGLLVSDVELEAGGPSYTIDTLTTLRERQPTVEWLVIVGADAAAGLDTWHRADDLRAMAEVVVVNRAGSDGRPPDGWRWQAVEIPGIAVSSTDLRDRVAAGRSVRFMVPPAVIDLIVEHEIYRRSS